MMVKKAIFLFDYTGIMAKPWADAGYLCYCFDGQHKPGVNKSEQKNVMNVGMWFTGENDIEKIISVTGHDVSFVFGFPECTDLAVSGAAHFAKKRLVNPEFQNHAMKFVYLVRDLGNELGCPWALENPVSVISTKWRKPDFTFHPWFYGGYLPVNDVHPLYPDYINPRDAYPKKTCIWYGNGFTEPVVRPVAYDKGYSKQHKKLGGKSLKTKNIRSATPRGFAKAVFLFNH